MYNFLLLKNKVKDYGIRGIISAGLHNADDNYLSG